MLDVIFPFIGGVGLFLVGMMLLSKGLVAFAGQTLRKALVRFTGTPLKAFASGAFMTALMQSSTATTVTLIGFVSAGLISFSHAIGVVMGASLGNTAAGWLVSGVALKVNLSFYTMPLIGIGALIKLLARGRIADLGMTLSGFGILFLGLRTLQDAMSGLTGHVDLATLPVGGLGAHLIIMLIGLAMTALLQSSTAAIATTLTAVHAGAISLDQAGSVIVGAAIGTTLTSALVSIGASTAAKRTALAHILFNVVVGLIAILLLPAYLFILTRASNYLGIAPGALSLAAFHTLFILVGSAIFLPFTERFARLVERLLPEKANDLTPHLDDTLLGVPDIALEASQRTIEELAQQLFAIHQQLIHNEGRPNLTRLEAHMQALESVFDFVTRTRIDSDDKTLNPKKVAQLHSIDHLIRLAVRQHYFIQEANQINQRAFAKGIALCQEQLHLIQSGLEHDTPLEWVKKLKTKAKALKDLSAETRSILLQRPGQASSNRDILLETDNYRWLERNAHHIWRIGYYLQQARQAQKNEKGFL